MVGFLQRIDLEAAARQRLPGRGNIFSSSTHANRGLFVSRDPSEGVVDEISICRFKEIGQFFGDRLSLRLANVLGDIIDLDVGELGLLGSLGIAGVEVGETGQVATVELGQDLPLMNIAWPRDVH